MIRCIKCPKRILKKNIKRHIETEHSGVVTKYGCTVCDPTNWFQNLYNYEAHFKKKHPSLLKPGPLPTKKPHPPLEGEFKNGQLIERESAFEQVFVEEN